MIHETAYDLVRVEIDAMATTGPVTPARLRAAATRLRRPVPGQNVTTYERIRRAEVLELMADNGMTIKEND